MYLYFTFYLNSNWAGYSDIITAVKFALESQHNQSKNDFKFHLTLANIDTVDAYKLSRIICRQVNQYLFSTKDVYYILDIVFKEFSYQLWELRIVSPTFDKFFKKFFSYCSLSEWNQNIGNVSFDSFLEEQISGIVMVPLITLIDYSVVNINEFCSTLNSWLLPTEMSKNFVNVLRLY